MPIGKPNSVIDQSPRIQCYAYLSVYMVAYNPLSKIGETTLLCSQKTEVPLGLRKVLLFEEGRLFLRRTCGARLVDQTSTSWEVDNVEGWSTEVGADILIDPQETSGQQ